MIKVIELGPFGCTLDHGTINSLSEIPEGYTIKNIVTSLGSKTALIEPYATLETHNTPSIITEKKNLHRGTGV